MASEIKVSGGHTLVDLWSTTPLTPLIDEPGTLSTLFKSGINYDDDASQILTGIGDGLNYGGGKVHAAPIDATPDKRLICIHFSVRENRQINGVANINTNTGYILTLYSAADQYRRWVVGGKDHNPSHESYQCAVVDPHNAAGAFYSTMAFDPSNIIRTEMHVTKDNMNNTFHIFSRQFYVDPYVITGGYTGNFANFSYIIAACVADHNRIIRATSATKINLKAPYQIGDGMTPTVYVQLGHHFNFMSYANVSTKYMTVQTRENILGMTILSNAYSVIKHFNCAWFSDSPFHWRVDGGGDISFANSYILNAGDVFLGSGVVLHDFIITFCNEVTVTNPVWDNITINYSKSTYAVTLNNFTNVKNSVFANNNRAIRITQAGDYVFDGLKFTDNTFDVETTHTSGEVKINIINGGDIPTVNQAGTGTVTVLMDSYQLKVINLESTNVYVQTNEGTTHDFVENVTGNYTKSIPGNSIGVWTVVIKRIGYINKVISFVPKLAGETVINGVLRQDLAEAATPLYRPLPTTGVQIVVDNKENTARIILSQGQHSTRKIYNAIQEKMVKEDGLKWITTHHIPQYFPSALGNILVLHENWRIISELEGTSVTVLGAIQTTAADNIITTSPDISIIYAGGSVFTMQNVRDALNLPASSGNAVTGSIDDHLLFLRKNMATKKDINNSRFI